MRKKILSALLLGLFTVASTSTFVSCKDYDDDISNLQEQITQNNKDLTKLVDDKIAIVNAEIQKVNDALDAAEKACADADKKLQANIDAANKAITDGDAATLAAAKKAVEDAMVQVAATYATKAELQKAQSDLETAYKAADELIKKDVESNAKEIANLLEADKKLDAAVKAAQATADDALTLAKNIEKTYATKAELADEIKKVNESLAGVKKGLEDKIGENLKKISALEERAGNIETDVKANGEAIKALQKLTKEHTSTLEALGSHMNVVCDSLKTLDAAIASNAARIETVKDSLATAYTQAIEGATTTLNASISASNVRIDSLNGAVNDQISTINGTLETASKDIDSIGQVIDKVIERVGAIESRLAIINADLSNLITSIIYNGQSKGAVLFGKMDSNISGTFPYSGYKGNDSIALRGDSVLMTADGIVYATINPAEIDFAGTGVKLVNSQNNEHALFALNNAEVVTESDPVLSITRGTKNFGNGLYKFQIKVNNPGIKVEQLTGKNSIYAVAPSNAFDPAEQKHYIAYALQTTYTAGDSSRTVTSHYDVAIMPQVAETSSSIDIKAVKPGVDVADPAKPYTIKYDIDDDGSDLVSGEFTINPDKNVYAVYVKLDTTGVAQKQKFAEVKLSENGVLTGADITKKIKISAPDSLLNVTIPVKAYGLNYDGSIVETRNEKVVFTRSIFGTINISLEATIDSAKIHPVDATAKLIEALKAKKGDKAEALFASMATSSLADSLKQSGTPAEDSLRLHLSVGHTPKDSITANMFSFNPKFVKFGAGESSKDVAMTYEVTDASGLAVATINYTLKIKAPTKYDGKMRIASAFNIIDAGEHTKDYTLAWALKDTTYTNMTVDKNFNADTTKIGYKWDKLSFAVTAKFMADRAKFKDNLSTLTYANVNASDNAFNQHFGENADATDSVDVKYLRVFSSDQVKATNMNTGAPTDQSKTIFNINQNVNYFGVVSKTIDTFWFSVASPINYGIVQGGAKSIEATVENVGKQTVGLSKDFQWIDFSNNRQSFGINDGRIKSITCTVKSSADYVDQLIYDVSVDRAAKNLIFYTRAGVATGTYNVDVEFVITDIWNIQTKLPGVLTIKAYNSTNP